MFDFKYHLNFHLKLYKLSLLNLVNNLPEPYFIIFMVLRMPLLLLTVTK